MLVECVYVRACAPQYRSGIRLRRSQAVSVSQDDSEKKSTSPSSRECWV